MGFGEQYSTPDNLWDNIISYLYLIDCAFQAKRLSFLSSKVLHLDTRWYTQATFILAKSCDTLTVLTLLACLDCCNKLSQTEDIRFSQFWRWDVQDGGADWFGSW